MSRHISFRQGRKGAKPPPLVPPGLPSTTVSAARIVRHLGPNHQSPPHDSPDGHGSHRPPARGLPVLPTRPSSPPLGLPLPRLSLFRRFLAHKVRTAPRPPFPRYQPQPSSNSASSSSATRALTGRANDAPNKPVMSPFGTSSSGALRSSPIISSLILHTNGPLCLKSVLWPTKDAPAGMTTGPFCWCRNQPPPCSRSWHAKRACNSVRVTRLLNDEPTRICVPLFMRPWIMQAYHVNVSCHIGVALALSMLERFYR